MKSIKFYISITFIHSFKWQCQYQNFSERGKPTKLRRERSKSSREKKSFYSHQQCGKALSSESNKFLLRLSFKSLVNVIQRRFCSYSGAAAMLAFLSFSHTKTSTSAQLSDSHVKIYSSCHFLLALARIWECAGGIYANYILELSLSIFTVKAT